MSQKFHRHPDLPAHQDHLETQQSTVMDIFQPKAAGDLQWQRKEQRDCDTSGHPTPRMSHQEQASIIISLAHTLKGLRQDANEINLQVTELYWELSPAQWEKAQNGCKESYSMAQQKEITSLQEALIAAGHQSHENPPDRTCK